LKEFRHDIVEAIGGHLFLGVVDEGVQPGEQPLIQKVRRFREVAFRNKVVDVRVIAATNRNLKEEVKKGNFREDLYFRISVVQVHLPALRKRSDDIPMLANHFVELNHKSSGNERNKNVRGITPEALQVLKEYHWPGNIRELKNVIDRSASFCEKELIDIGDLPEYLREKSVVTTSPRIRGDIPFKDAKEQWLESFEKDYLVDLLKRNNLNISKAAKQAGIDRKSVQRLLKKYNLNVKDIS
jgi:DNA-binding NtrC family response regulator